MSKEEEKGGEVSREQGGEQRRGGERLQITDYKLLITSLVANYRLLITKY